MKTYSLTKSTTCRLGTSSVAPTVHGIHSSETRPGNEIPPISELHLTKFNDNVTSTINVDDTSSMMIQIMMKKFDDDDDDKTRVSSTHSTK